LPTPRRPVTALAAGYVHAGYVHAGYVHGAGRRGIRVGSRVVADGMLSITGSIRAALPLSRL
jgi:hypothetical protein